LVSTLPDTTLGPVLHGDPPSSAAFIASLLKNDPAITRFLPARELSVSVSCGVLQLLFLTLSWKEWHVDVRDTARLHLLGLTTPSLGGKRILAAAGPWGWNEILGILRKHFPNVQVPEDFEGGEPDRQRIDSEVAREMLGGWIGLEQSVVDLAKSLGY
jgi:hypothetical protein